MRHRVGDVITSSSYSYGHNFLSQFSHLLRYVWNRSHMLIWWKIVFYPLSKQPVRSLWINHPLLLLLPLLITPPCMYITNNVRARAGNVIFAPDLCVLHHRFGSNQIKELIHFRIFDLPIPTRRKPPEDEVFGVSWGMNGFRCNYSEAPGNDD